MKARALIVLVLFFYNSVFVATPVATTTELSFKITYHNYHLGYINAVKAVSDATNTYSVLGKAEGDLFFKKIVSENSIYTVFDKNEFVKSTTIVKRNGKILHNTHTTLLKGKYFISSIETADQLLNQGINYTVALMYFQEPVGVNYVYSETWGKMLPLIANKGNYTFTIPDGTVCSFEYKDGKLMEVVSKTIIGEIKFTKE